MMVLSRRHSRDRLLRPTGRTPCAGRPAARGRARHGRERHPAGRGRAAPGRGRPASSRRPRAPSSSARTPSPAAGWGRPPSRRPCGPSRASAGSWTPTASSATARSPRAPCARRSTATPSSTACACAPGSTSRSSTARRRTASPTWRCARRSGSTRRSPAGDALLVEVGGGSADLSFLRRGEPVYSGTYALGAIRMRQNLAAWHGSHEQRVRLFHRTVQNIVEDIRREMPLREARHFLALGGDARFAADQIVGDDAGAAVRDMPRERFLSFCEQIGGARRRAARGGLPPAPRRGRDARAGAARLPRAAARDPGREGARARRRRCGRGCCSTWCGPTRGRGSRTCPARCWPPPPRSARSTATTRAHARARGVARRRSSSTT